MTRPSVSCYASAQRVQRPPARECLRLTCQRAGAVGLHARVAAAGSEGGMIRWETLIELKFLNSSFSSSSSR